MTAPTQLSQPRFLLLAIENPSTSPSMIDFTELPEDGISFEQFVRELLLLQEVHPQWTGKGPDQGRDLIITETANGPIGDFSRRWLVQCKHLAHSGRSVGREHIDSVIDDCKQAGASGYLLVCSTQPSSSLVTKLEQIAAHPELGLTTRIWDAVDLEKRLAEPRAFSLGHLFFPKSFASTPWKLYNRGAPNTWTGHYRDYYLHLNSRIAGSYPSLTDCEAIVARLERIACGEGEYVRPRAIYFDDKHSQFTVYADYLVPRSAAPSLTPVDFESVLRDGHGLYEDEYSMWALTDWDIRLRRILPHSDHFHVDHYDYYNRDDGNFRVGGTRGDSIGELARYGNQWR